MVDGELNLVGEELDQVDSIWGQTRRRGTCHGAILAATVPHILYL